MASSAVKKVRGDESIKALVVPRARSGKNFPRSEGCQNEEISGVFCGLPAGGRSESTC